VKLEWGKPEAEYDEIQILQRRVLGKVIMMIISCVHDQDDL
jgi:hypothetical protein